MSRKMNEKLYLSVITIVQLIKTTNICSNRINHFFSFTLIADLYNALTIHGIVQLSNFPKSVLDLNQFWKTTAYKVSSDIYSLDDIEHGILRGFLCASTRQNEKLIRRSMFFLRFEATNHIRTVHNVISLSTILEPSFRCVDVTLEFISLWISPLDRVLRSPFSRRVTWRNRWTWPPRLIAIRKSTFKSRPTKFFCRKFFFGIETISVDRISKFFGKTFASIVFVFSIRFRSVGSRSSSMNRNDRWFKLCSINKRRNLVSGFVTKRSIGFSTIRKHFISTDRRTTEQNKTLKPADWSFSFVNKFHFSLRTNE